MLKKFALLALLLNATDAFALETKARNAILIDYETGSYLFVKDHQKPVPPASMSKLMTIYMLFDKLKDGSLDMEDNFKVSENAWRQGGAASGGSTMFLKLNSDVSVEDLIKGIVIQSGNDACIVVAENISGSEEDFADEMNKKAKKLGLNNTNFANATGLPHPDHRMSAEDLSKLARLIISEFPDYYHYFSQKEFVYNNIKQGNRNPLLYSMQYADGLKTGHTEEAGFSLTASAKKGERRLISVMTGMASHKERGEEAEKLMSWGFREFDNYNMLTKGEEIAEVPTWLGTPQSVKLLVGEDVRGTLQKSSISKIKMTAIYNKPIKAPVKKGDKLGIIKIEVPGQEDRTVDLISDRDVGKIGIFGRIMHNIEYLVFGSN